MTSNNRDVKTTTTNMADEYKPVGTPRINHKVEQIVRAVLFGFPQVPFYPENHCSTVLQVSCNTVPIICQYDEYDHVIIGLADERGYRFNPESNSALIWLGIHPSAFLLHLTKCVRDGVPCVRELSTGNLSIEFGALVNCARDAVFNWEKMEVIDGKKQRRKPLLEAYILSGKPKTFT